MNKGGYFDTGYCIIRVVPADHSSSCLGDNGI